MIDNGAPSQCDFPVGVCYAIIFDSVMIVIAIKFMVIAIVDTDNTKCYIQECCASKLSKIVNITTGNELMLQVCVVCYYYSYYFLFCALVMDILMVHRPP
jgi:hypothetical protein